MAESNRRGAVRVSDRVLLAVKRVTRERYVAVAAEYEHGISLYNQEGLADIQMYVGAEGALSRLKERDADLAEFLRYLDTKLNLVLKRSQGERTPFDELRLQKVNLSGSGVAFAADEEFREQEMLEIHLVLLPAYTYIYCFGTVVSCERVSLKGQEKSAFRIGVEFTLITDDDREKLIQHNFKQQSLA
ncbi:MAG TPA: PilZ domain-containing protein, partial [Desulfurivibrionaceae bacterium]|nr:PilZ domain-containing protein [Desulfurivibrionaceae bacterium]